MNSLIVQNIIFFVSSVIFIVVAISKTLRDVNKEIQKSNEISKMKKDTIYDKKIYIGKKVK